MNHPRKFWTCLWQGFRLFYGPCQARTLNFVLEYIEEPFGPVSNVHALPLRCVCFSCLGDEKCWNRQKKTVLVVSHPNKWCFRFGNVPVEFPSILIHLAGLSPFQICPTRWKALDVSFWVCVKTRTGFQHVWKKAFLLNIQWFSGAPLTIAHRIHVWYIY